MNPKKILTSLLILGLGLFSPAKVLADQYGQYGKAEEAAQISIDKKVKHPQSTTKGGEPVWVENLFADDYKFVPGEVVEFKLTIVNTGSIDLENVRVRDNLPGQLELVSGALDFTISKLESGQSYESDVIKARVKNNGQDGVYCLLNIGEVWADSQW